MQTAGRQFLAGAALADQQDRAFDRGDTGEAFLKVQERFGLAEAFLVLGGVER